MLLELYVRNFALIEEVSIAFGAGLNILTGETGAGKSLLVGALDFVRGGRARTEWIRTGTEETEVHALFDTSAHQQVQQFLKDSGYPGQDDLHLKRILHRSGKNRVFINDRPATVPMLIQLADRLIDIHGQHEHQSLLKVARHQEVLDLFGNCSRLRKEVADLYTTVRRGKDQLKEYETSLRTQRQQQELMTYQLEELCRARLVPSEQEELEIERRQLINIEKLMQLCREGEALLYSQRQSIGDQLAQLSKRIAEARDIDPAFGDLRDLLDAAIVNVQEAARLLQERSLHLHADPKRLEEVEERLMLLNQLKRKYHCTTIEELIAKRDSIQKGSAHLAELEARLSDLEESVRTTEGMLRTKALELSEVRKSAAVSLRREVERELRTIGMKKTGFRVAIESTWPVSQERDHEYLTIEDLKISPTGCDHVEFLICTNPGEPYRPLHRIASGGELSRIMLAIRNVLHEEDGPYTLVFDEIDAGIGGAEAEMVGSRLKALAKSFQVLCITHLPQIAAFADTHLKVSKRMAKDRTEITVYPLDVSGREMEIARMLGGRKITSRALEHAREVLAHRQGESR